MGLKIPCIDDTSTLHTEEPQRHRHGSFCKQRHLGLGMKLGLDCHPSRALGPPQDNQPSPIAVYKQLGAHQSYLIHRSANCTLSLAWLTSRCTGDDAWQQLWPQGGEPNARDGLRFLMTLDLQDAIWCGLDVNSVFMRNRGIILRMHESLKFLSAKWIWAVQEWI